MLKLLTFFISLATCAYSFEKLYELRLLTVTSFAILTKRGLNKLMLLEFECVRITDSRAHIQSFFQVDVV